MVGCSKNNALWQTQFPRNRQPCNHYRRKQGPVHNFQHPLFFSLDPKFLKGLKAKTESNRPIVILIFSIGAHLIISTESRFLSDGPFSFLFFSLLFCFCLTFKKNVQAGIEVLGNKGLIVTVHHMSQWKSTRFHFLISSLQWWRKGHGQLHDN